MRYPEVYEKCSLSGEELSRAKARYILNAVALRQSVSGSVIHLSRSLELSDSALQVFLSRRRFPKKVWVRLAALMTEEEREAFQKEVRVPHE